MKNKDIDNKEITHISRQIKEIQKNISKVFVGKIEQVNTMLLGFISGLHVLIEDVPGVGKTTLAKCLAASVGLDFARIQFTPDLLPGDIIGMTVWDQVKREFLFKEGGIMHQFILADEINRATPRTQASLLEAMEDESVSVDGKTYHVPQPFFVIATQNPSHFLGAFQLPEAELDRFGISFSLGYPQEDEGIEIIEKDQKIDPFTMLKPVITPKEILFIRKKVQSIYASSEIKRYIMQIAGKSRSNRYIKLGLSTRAAKHLLIAAKAYALTQARSFIIPEDIIDLSITVLAHRIIFSTGALMENKTKASVIENVINSIKKPTGIK